MLLSRGGVLWYKFLIWIKKLNMIKNFESRNKILILFKFPVSHRCTEVSVELTKVFFWWHDLTSVGRTRKGNRKTRKKRDTISKFMSTVA